MYWKENLTNRMCTGKWEYKNYNVYIKLWFTNRELTHRYAKMTTC